MQKTKILLVFLISTLGYSTSYAQDELSKALIITSETHPSPAYLHLTNTITLEQQSQSIR